VKEIELKVEENGNKGKVDNEKKEVRVRKSKTQDLCLTPGLQNLIVALENR
jgi:hypothetical protein